MVFCPPPPLCPQHSVHDDSFREDPLFSNIALGERGLGKLNNDLPL